MAPIASVAWLERMPYQGCDSSSCRSIVESTATQAPAVGPPSTIAAPMNGMWNVIRAAAGLAEDPQRAEQAVDQPQEQAAGRAGQHGGPGEPGVDRRLEGPRDGRPQDERRAEDDLGRRVGEQAAPARHRGRGQRRARARCPAGIEAEQPAEDDEHLRGPAARAPVAGAEGEGLVAAAGQRP